MQRATTALIFLLLSACGKTSVDLTQRLPKSLPGGYQQQRATSIPVPADGGPLQTYRAQQAVEGTYSGPHPLLLRAYQLPTATVAFEVIQKWQRQPREVVCYNEDLVFVISSDDAPVADLRQACQSLQ